MLSKLTMVGLYNYSKQTLFEQMELPTDIDKEVLISEILRQGAEFPVLYSDLEFMKAMIGAWSKKWYHNFDRMVKANKFEYEALYNLDVKSTRTEKGNNESASDLSGSNTSTSSGNRTVNDSKAAFDSTSLQPTTAEQEFHSDTSGSGMTSHNEGTTSHEIEEVEIRQGNQGVTMSQEMLLAEYNAWLYNLYDHIASIFVNEFCICIYV